MSRRETTEGRVATARWPGVALAALTAATLTSCSLLGLTDGITQAPCSENESCSVLNPFAPELGECESYECNPEGLCEIMVTDGDDDGAPNAACVTGSVEPDCDDDDRYRRPGGPLPFSARFTRDGVAAGELLDGIDNDCDGEADDLNVTATPRGEDGFGAIPTSRAWVPRSEGLLLAFGQPPAGQSDGRNLHYWSATAPSPTDTGEEMSSIRGDIAAAAAGNVVGFGWVGSPTDCDQALSVATLDETSTSGALAVEDLSPLGTCSPGDVPALGGPMLAMGSEERAVVGWREAGADAGCGGRTADDVAMLALTATTTTGLTAGTRTPERLGVHTGKGAPAIARVLAGATFDYIAAVTNPEGRVELYRLDLNVSASPSGLTATLLHTEPACSGACDDLALGVYENDADPAATEEIGLAYVDRGCDDVTGTLTVRRFTVDGDSLTPMDEAPAVSVEGVSDGSALMARSGDMPRWYIVYRLESQVFVQGFGGAEPVVAFPIGGTEAPAPGFRPGLDYGQDGRTELRVAFVTAEGIEQASVEIDDPVVRAERDLQMSLAPTTDGGS